MRWVKREVDSRGEGDERNKCEVGGGTGKKWGGGREGAVMVPPETRRSTSQRKSAIIRTGRDPGQKGPF